MSPVIGIDLGGTKIAVGLVDARGIVLRRLERATPARDGGDAIVATVIDLARELRDGDCAGESGGEGGAEIRGIGIGSAGLIDEVSGVVTAATSALSEWVGTPLTARVSTALALPTRSINDVHAHAMGEAWVGSARSAQRVLMIAAGTGIGGAWLRDGEVERGAHVAAGHFGHVPSEEAASVPCSCGRIGHLEAIASGPAIHAAYLRDGGNPLVVDTRQLVARAEGGDTHAERALVVGGRALGRTIGGFVNALDPELVVIAGGLSHAGQLWWDALNFGITGELMDAVSETPIVASALGQDAAIVGAARLILRALDEEQAR